jgi:hypothetical protein
MVFLFNLFVNFIFQRRRDLEAPPFDSTRKFKKKEFEATWPSFKATHSLVVCVYMRHREEAFDGEQGDPIRISRE